MACYNPSHMAVVDLKTSGAALIHKQRFKEIGWQVNIEHHRAFKYLGSNLKDRSLEEVFKLSTYDILEVPCGNCIGCRLDYSKDWATRADLEAKQYQYNWFITLTYDDEFLPQGKKDNPTLSKEDAHDFIKAVRNYFYQEYGYTGIRFLLAGEYGSVTNRPHYHLILFNCPLPDLKPYTIDKDGNYMQQKDAYGQPYLFSKIIENAWSKGFVTISEASWYTSAYVSQYIIKKQRGESSEVYNVLGIVAPFMRCSNKPGIGYKYFEDNAEHLAEYPLLYIPRANKKPLSTRAPRYFKKKIVENDLIDYEQYFIEGLEHAERARSLMSHRSTINVQRSLKEAETQSFIDIKSRLL